MQKLLFLLFFFAVTAAQAQQATNSASGTGQAGNIVLDWSFGELTLVSSARSSSLLFTQGLHQGKLTALIAGSGNTIGSGEIVVTPNPTPDQASVRISFLEAGQLSLRLFDAGGKLLLQSSNEVNTFTFRNIDLTPYANGLYLLEAVFQPSSGGGARKNTYKILRKS